MGERQGITIGKVLTLQLLIISAITIGFLTAAGRHAALMCLLGGMAAFMPNLYLAARIQRAKDKSAKTVVSSFYKGESGKLVLTAILFYLIFQVPQIQIIPLLAGYMAALSVFWFALIMR